MPPPLPLRVAPVPRETWTSLLSRMRGEAVFLIRDDRLVPVSDWDLSTRDGIPRAYRLSVPEVGGGYTMTALAAEVLHVRLASDPYAPWSGVSPLRRARLRHETVRAVRDSLEAIGEIRQCSTRLTKDGRQYPARRPRTTFRGDALRLLLLVGRHSRVARRL